MRNFSLCIYSYPFFNCFYTVNTFITFIDFAGELTLLFPIVADMTVFSSGILEPSSETVTM